MRSIFIKLIHLFILFCSFFSPAEAAVVLGVDRLQEPQYKTLFSGKKIGLVTNQTGKTAGLIPTQEIVLALAREQKGKLVALFAPEHGLTGSHYAEKRVEDELWEKVPVYSLYGKTAKPTKEMLQGIDLLLFDIQDIGSRSYTYATTLFYLMEAASASHIPVVVLDRPNPLGGLNVDGPLLEDKWRSFVGYINVPYCHGMTIGELALFFNGEYNVGCDLTVIPMKGWQREMLFDQTELHWIPPSPQIPESTTSLFYPMTGLLGQLSIVSIGIGYTLPFKVVAAPWIEGEYFAKKLNEQNFAGVCFVPIHFTPFTGKYAKEECHGVLIIIKNVQEYKPLAVQFLLLGMIKSLYPEEFRKRLLVEKQKVEGFCRACGTDKVYQLLQKKGPVVWPLQKISSEGTKNFLERRKKYLIKSY